MIVDTHQTTKIIALAFLFGLFACPFQKVSAQTVHDFGAWFSANTMGKFFQENETSKLRWWFDGHLRYLDDAGGFNQSIFRPGLGYQINENTTAWIGYAWINSNPPSGNPVFDENRLWQQLLWSKKVGQYSLMSRSRLEQRWVETGSDNGWRFRQFVRMHRPVFEESPLIFVLWDELFFDLNETDWGQQGSLSQNRMFVGLGRHFFGPHKPRLEVGYLNQFERRKSGDDRFNHILSVNWFWSF